MKVFISWSGARSKNVAELLRGWIPKVLQAIRPWMSEEDISTGTRWSAEIASELEKSKAGIVCITPENQHNPWLMFEAGALSKTLTETFVCPYLYDLSPSQLSGPISQFQATLATKEGTLKIIQTLNKALGESQINNAELDEIFDVWWPKLEEKFSSISSIGTDSVVKRTKDDILEEILKNSREQMRREEIRLNAFQIREQKIDTVLHLLEGWMKTIKESSSVLDTLKGRMNKLSIEKEELLNDKNIDPKEFAVALKDTRFQKLFKLSDGAFAADNMTEMMNKLKELSVDKKIETNQLLNPDSPKEE